MPSPPRLKTTHTMGQRSPPTSTAVAAARLMPQGRPSRLVLRVRASLTAVAMISPAATAPMPRSAPTTSGLSENCW